jgi:ATP-dependent Clp protease ATP-binding subunit ClpC
MQVSASIEIVMQLAGQEAVAAQYKEIEPEHLLAGILKFSELPVEDVDKIAPGAEVAKVLAAEVNAIREELTGRSIDSTRVRRQLRGRLGKGDSQYDGGAMHRSQASRALFDAAARTADEAGSETLTAKHLLDAILAQPTAAMAQVLGEAANAGGAAERGQQRPKGSGTPVLDAFGQDLTQLAAQKPSSCPSERKAECKGLVQALVQAGRCGIFMVTEDDEAVRSVVLAAAGVVSGKDCPKALKGQRIVDLTGIKPQGADVQEAVERLEKALVEAKTAKNIILFVSPLLPPRTGAKGDWWIDMLRSALVDGTVKHICRASEAGYRRVEKDPTWRRRAQVMWIHKEQRRELPGEL